MDYLLTDRELFLVYQLDLVFAQRFKELPMNDENIFYFLGDRFEHSLTWSAHGRIPCYRKNPARYLHRQSMRFLTGRDKLASLGWPVTDQLATNLLTTKTPSIENDRSDFLAGNSMHLANASTILLIGLCCFSPRVQPDYNSDFV